MGNTQQAGIKKDDHGGSCNQEPQAATVAPDQLRADHGGSRDQQPQATFVAPDQLRAGVKGDDHGGCSRDQQQQVVSVVDLDQFQAAPLKNCKKNSATDGGGRSSRIDILGSTGESVILSHDDDPHHPSLPAADFVLRTLQVKSGCIGDGDGFTAYAKKVEDVAVNGSYKIGDTNNRTPQQYKIRMRSDERGGGGKLHLLPPSTMGAVEGEMNQVADATQDEVIYENCIANQLLDLNDDISSNSLVPFEIPPLSSSAPYQSGIYNEVDMEDRFERKREGGDLESLHAEAMDDDDDISDTDNPLNIKKDNPESPSWQKSYDL